MVARSNHNRLGQYEERHALTIENKHKTVRVQVGSFEADIDEEIAPLIEEIWRADLYTINSCQENRPGIMWIQFMSADEAAAFLDIVAGSYSYELDSLYNRIRLMWDTDTGPVEGSWEYAISPFDIAVDDRIVDEYIDEEPTGPPQFVFNVSIRFPRSDVPILVQRLRAFNEAKSVTSETVLAPAPS